MSIKKPTIQDVARVASVSTATVSRVLNTPDLVSDDTRNKVNSAVLETGYTLNQTARSLRSRNTRTILVALPNISNPFFSPVLSAIEAEAAGRGYGVLVVNCIVDQTGHSRFEDYFQSSRADGLILCDGSMRPDYVRNLFPDPENTPVVIACEDIPNNDFLVVKSDNTAAAKTATEHLITLGHTRIAHISAPKDNVLYEERKLGFDQAMYSANLPIDPNYLTEGDFGVEGGANAARELLSLAQPPTGIFCANDETALGVIAAAHGMGVECPKDLSVIGFDGIDLGAHFLPPLTTMRQPTSEIGRIAAKSLLDMLELKTSKNDARRTVLSSELVVRKSTAAPRNDPHCISNRTSASVPRVPS